MKKLVKSLVIVVCIVMILVALGVGCTPEKTEDKPVETAVKATDKKEATDAPAEVELEHKTVTLALEDDGSIDWADPELWTMNLLEEAGNMTIEVMLIAQSDREAKMQTLIAGGNIPDMIYHEDEDWYWEYGERLFVQMDQYWDQLPNLVSRLEKYPNFYKNFQCSDGNIYGVPLIMDSKGYYSYMWMIRGDIVEAAGMPMADVTTLDDFTAALRLIKEAKGMSPWVARLNKDEPTFITRAAGAFGTGEKIYYNIEDSMYKLGPMDDNYKLMIETLAMYYDEGLIHPEIFSMSDQTWEQSILNDEGYFFIDNYKAKWVPDDSDRADFQVMLPPEINGKRYYGAQDRPHASPSVKYWVISNKTEALDNLLVALNWAYSDEAVNLFNYGILDETYKIIDGAPKLVWEGGPTAENYYEDNIKPLGIRSGRNVFAVTTESYLAQTLNGREFILERVNYYEDNGVVASAAPVFAFSEEDGDRVKMIEASIDTHISEQIARFITGIRDLSEYDAFVEELKAMNSDELVEIYNNGLAKLGD